MRRRLMPLAVAACLALAGCTSLPTSSAPAPFDVSARDSNGIQVSAEGPSDGADAATLVSDFLLACAAGPQDDYATARLFLSAASPRPCRRRGFPSLAAMNAPMLRSGTGARSLR